MGLGEADAPATRSGRCVDGQLLALGQRDGVVPASARVDVGTDDQHRVLGLGYPLRQRLHRRGVGARARADRPLDRVARLGLVHLGLPVVHRKRDEGRAARRDRRRVDPVSQRQRNVLGSRGLVAPLHEGVHDAGRVAVGQVGVHRHLGADLLARGDEQRRLVRLRVEERPHRVAHPGRGVQVDVGDPARGLGVPVGHPDHNGLLQPEHVAKVVGELRQHRQLGRAGVAEDRRHPVLAKELEGRLADGGHARDPNTWGAACSADTARRRRSQSGRGAIPAERARG